MLACPECDSVGKRRPRTLFERVFNRAKLKCPRCGDVWYWRRYFFQKYTRCPECGTARLSRRSRYDRIDRKSDSLLRRSLGLFGAPIYHCTFCRLQFRDFHGLEPNGKAKAQAQA
jgi:predicted RNA-binding Zn-ribbon protein involved in translation (DUF1610 family)